MLLIALVCGGLVWSALGSPAAPAQRPSVFAGSLVLADSRPLPVLDLARAAVTVRLQGVDSQVGARNYAEVEPVPVLGGTFLVDRRTGAFNFLGQDNYVTDPNGPGVGLGPLAGSDSAAGFAAGASAFIVRYGSAATVTLVDRATVESAARLTSAGGASGHSSGSVNPPGFARVGAPVLDRPGSVAVSGGDLWLLAASSGGCGVLQVHPDAASRLGVDQLERATEPVGCAGATLGVSGSSVGVARAGQVRVFSPPTQASGTGAVVATPFTRGARSLVAAQGSGPELWFLADDPGGWDLFGVAPSGRLSGPFRVGGLAAGALPAPPVEAAGRLFTLDRSAVGRPELLTISTADGRSAPVAGLATYPEASSERDGFGQAEVGADGPRVVFNNPGSLYAAVVFTDSTRAPAVIDKSSAVVVSATGPADLNVRLKAAAHTPSGRRSTATTAPPVSRPVPVVEPVSQQVTCANTTQKPYAPEITTVTPSSGAALVVWSYQLLDQTDCEPASWSVQVSALGGGHQPAQPVQTVQGQQQLLLSGLRPATSYSVTVTAYINRQSTTSPPVTFTTSARGPDAPASVTTSSDGRGHWIVSWVPCTESVNPQCVVAADVWTVIGSACGGSFVGTPPEENVAGTLNSVVIDATDPDLLGAKLSFSVQGSLNSGLTGDPTGDHSCTEAWRAPDAAAISLASSGTPVGGTITANLAVETTGDQTLAFGVPADQTEFVYRVGGFSSGPTSQARYSFPGLAAGTAYTATVSVYPLGHPEAAVNVSGTPFTQDLAWPADLGGSAVLSSATGTDPDTGTFTVTFPPDTPSGPVTAHGVVLDCGSALPQADQELSATTPRTITYPVDLVHAGGACTVTLVLQDGADPDPYGVPSPQITTPTAQVGPASGPNYVFAVTVDASCQDGGCGGPGSPWVLDVTPASPLGSGGGDWEVTSACTPGHGGGCGHHDACATDSGMLQSPPQPQYALTLPDGCRDYRAVQSVDVTVSWTYEGQRASADAGSPSGVNPPPTTTTSSTSSTSTTSTTNPGDTTSSSGSTTTTLAVCPTSTTSPTTVACRPAGGAAAASVLAAYDRPGVPSLAGPLVVWIAAATGALGLGVLPRRRRRRPPNRPENGDR